MGTDAARSCEEIVGVYATALDRGDYETARSQMSDSAVYKFRGTEVFGRTAILQIFADNEASALRNLDGLVFRSHVRLVGPDVVLVEMIDELTKGSDTHVYRSEQRVAVLGGMIVAIEQIEWPEERERLAMFFSRVGVNPGAP